MMVKLPSDAQIAQLCNGIYSYNGFPKITWDHLVISGGDAFTPSYGIKRLGDVDCIIFRGSTTTPDWLRDGEALADPFVHDFLGPVHPGFYKGLPQALEAILPLVGDKIIVGGHSLGAGEASIFTGLLIQAGRVPFGRVVFGEPRPGFPQLAKVLASVPARSYRNGDGDHHDLVTDVPFSIGIEDYVHPCPMTDVCEIPGTSWVKQWGIFAWHACPLYMSALQKRDGVALTATDTPAPPLEKPLHLEIH